MNSLWLLNRCADRTSRDPTSEIEYLNAGSRPDLPSSSTRVISDCDLRIPDCDLRRYGLMARRGVPMMARQTLVGYAYALLGDLSANISPKPDYFTTLLFKRLAGARSRRDLATISPRSRRDLGWVSA